MTHDSVSLHPMTDSSDFGQRPRRASFRFRSILNISMGLLYLILAGVIVTIRKFGTFDLGAGFFPYALGGLLALYGLFRIWRGVADIRAAKNGDVEY